MYIPIGWCSCNSQVQNDLFFWVEHSSRANEWVLGHIDKQQKMLLKIKYNQSWLRKY